MILVVGLGNPGKKYEKTRHNIGFMVVENLKHAPYRPDIVGTGAGLKVKSFSDWENKKKLLSEISKGEIAGQKIILAKPQTFMNESGESVKKLISNIQYLISNLWVVHDDIDLPLGKIRISKGQGSAGHKGVESIIRELGTNEFIRFRIGMNQFAQNQKSKIKNQKLDEFVLKKITKDKEKIVKEVIEKTVEAIEVAIKEGVEKAMNKYNC